MPAATDRLEFAPPQPPGMWRAFALAVLAHLLLLGALTWGVNWKRQSQDLSAEAELWSSVPQQAAPKLVEAPPPPPPPVEKVQPPAPPVPAAREADITLEREKKKKADEKKAEERRRDEAQRKQEQVRKQEIAQKAAETRKRQEEAAKAQKALEEAKAKALREENLRRMVGLAGATGASSATGNAQRSAGPSDSYAGRVRARIKPNIVFTDNIASNPETEIEVRAAPDGTIVGRKIVKPSGVKSWDDAVLKAIDKAEMLPRDVDGRVHSPLTLVLRPKD